MQRYQVQGMTCGHCERAVIQAIQARDPEATVTVDLGSGWVEVDGRLTADEVRAAIAEEGYQVR